MARAPHIARNENSVVVLKVAHDPECFGAMVPLTAKAKTGTHEAYKEQVNQSTDGTSFPGREGNSDGNLRPKQGCCMAPTIREWALQEIITVMSYHLAPLRTGENTHQAI